MITRMWRNEACGDTPIGFCVITRIEAEVTQHNTHEAKEYDHTE